MDENMALIGKIEEYNENDSWIEYTERPEHYFAVNEITDKKKKKKRAVLLSTCAWSENLQASQSLVNPKKPTDKSFQELVNLMKNNLNPRPSSIVYWFKFNSRLSGYCEFNDKLEKCFVNDCFLV